MIQNLTCANLASSELARTPQLSSDQPAAALNRRSIALGFRDHPSPRQRNNIGVKRTRLAGM